MKGTRKLELWFDFSCPYAYLGFTQAPALAREVGAELVLEPMLLGGVFRAREVPQNLAGSLSAQKAAHNAADLRRYADLFGVPLLMPAGHPIRTVGALRAMLAAGAPFEPLAESFFRAYWVDGIDLSKPEGVKAVLERTGHDSDVIMKRAESNAIKEELRVRTDRAISKGVFGAPAFFVEDVLYWGQDRLDEVRLALGGELPPEPLFDPVLHARTAPTELWFDYASPFSYLAVRRARALFGPSLRSRPVLLSALLTQVNGHPERPFMNDAKSAFHRADLLRQAARYGIALAPGPLPPTDTRAAIAISLALGQGGAPGAVDAFAAALFAARYERGEPIHEVDRLVSMAAGLGLGEAALRAAANDAGTDEALAAATREALELGLFGVPSFVVRPPGREPSVYFGHDRMGLALRAARGDSRLY